jgi:hypothetical protein
MMGTKQIVAFCLCVFLTTAPILGSFMWAESTLAVYIGNFTPYTHLTMPQLGGLPFAESIGGFFGILITVIGIIGLLIFVVTKFRKPGGLLLLLYLTMLYCGLRILGALAFNGFSFQDYNTKEKLFLYAALFSDFAWGILCFWATTVLPEN